MLEWNERSDEEKAILLGNGLLELRALETCKSRIVIFKRFVTNIAHHIYSGRVLLGKQREAGGTRSIVPDNNGYTRRPE